METVKSVKKSSVFMKDNEVFLKITVDGYSHLFLTLAAKSQHNNLKIAYRELLLYLCSVFQNTDLFSI